MKKVLLLDIENISKAESKLAQYCSEYHRIYVVYANFNVKFSLDELFDLIPFILKGKLKIIKMAKTGKDSADFGLAFLAGQLSRKKKREFHIMSNDHSMEYIVDLLQQSNHKAILLSKNLLNSQLKESESVDSDINLELDTISGLKINCVELSNNIDSSDEASTSPPVKNDVSQKESEAAINEAFLKYCEHLALRRKHRPLKLKRLNNSIKFILKDENMVLPVIKLLEDKKLINLSSSRIIYDDALINGTLKRGGASLKTRRRNRKKL